MLCGRECFLYIQRHLHVCVWLWLLCRRRLTSLQVRLDAMTSQGVEAPEGPDRGLIIDEELMLKQSNFPIPPEKLIFKAKHELGKALYKSDNLAEDFQFTAPFVGPLNREQFRNTLETLALEEAFPDLQPRLYHFRVDPFEPNRVWFTTRPIGTHTRPFKGALPYTINPTNKRVELPPQTSSLTFNERGEVIGFTMGYVMDRRIGNSGGLGGAFGFLYAIGVPFPFPEGKPWEPSLQQTLFNKGGFLQAAVFATDRVMSRVLPNWLVTKHARNLQ